MARWAAAALLAAFPASGLSLAGSRIVNAGSLGYLPPDVTAPALLKSLSALRKRKDWQAAQEMLWAASARTGLLQPIHYNIVLAALSDAAEWEQALMLLEHMPSAGVAPDVYSYAAAITACSHAEQPDRAISLFKKMCTTDVVPNLVCFNTALAACQRTRRYSQLLALFGAMPAYHVQPDSWAYSAAIDAVARVGQWERALKLLDDLEQAARAGGNSTTAPDQHCYGAAMRACLRVHKYDAVLALYERLRTAGVEPNSHTLASCLTAAALSVPTALGWERAMEMLRTTTTRSAGSANVHCYTVVLQACQRAGRWREALALLDEMTAREVRPNAHSYAAVIGAHAEGLMWQEALALLERMGKEGIQVDAHVVSAALVVCREARQWEAASHLLRVTMGRLGLRPSAVHVHSALKCCVLASQLPEALRLIGFAEEIGVTPDRPMIELALAICARSGASGQALKLLRLLTKEGLPLTDRMRCSVITAIGRAGELQLALRFLTPQSDVACHNAALSAMARAGEWADALDLYQCMEERGPQPDHITQLVVNRVRAAIGREAHYQEGDMAHED